MRKSPHVPPPHKESNAQVMSAVKHMLYYLLLFFKKKCLGASRKGSCHRVHVPLAVCMHKQSCRTCLTIFNFFNFFFVQQNKQETGPHGKEKKIKKCLGASRRRSCHRVHVPLPVWTPLQNPTPTQTFNIV